MLEITDYKKFYHDELIIQINQLFLEEGFYWVRGENGSGKSTVMKSIAGLIPFEGTIKLFGKVNNFKNQKQYRTLVRYAQAEPIFPDFLKGDDLVKTYLKITKSNPNQVQYIIEQLGVGKFLSKKISEYSSGMLKKLSLVLAFVGQPKLILLDEPFSTLDADTSKKILQIMEERVRQGVSIIITSHQAFEHILSLQTFLIENREMKPA